MSPVVWEPRHCGREDHGCPAVVTSPPFPCECSCVECGAIRSRSLEPRWEVVPHSALVMEDPPTRGAWLGWVLFFAVLIGAAVFLL